MKQKVPVVGGDPTNGYIIDCLTAPDSAWPNNGSTWHPWQSSYALNVPPDWVSGVYLARLTTLPVSGSGKQAFVIFVVREDDRGSDLFIQTSVATYQAYNPWGGNSIYWYPYQQLHPDTLPATVVSFNRPYAGPSSDSSRSFGGNIGTRYLTYGTGAGEFFVIINYNESPAWECYLVRWVERQGYDSTYCTSADTHFGALTSKRVKAFLSVGHDEYWSQQMKDNVQGARDLSVNPVNLCFLSANACNFRIHPDAGFRNFSVQKFIPDNYDLFRNLSPNQHEAELIGVEYMYNTVTPHHDMTIPAGVATHWAYDYTGIVVNGYTIATTLPGLLGSEVDGWWDGTPPVCRNYYDPLHRTDVTELAVSDFPVLTPGTDGCGCPQPGDPMLRAGASRMTVYTAASGAQVFATGSMQWNWGLDDYGYRDLYDWKAGSYASYHSDCADVSATYPPCLSPIAQQMTHNVFRKSTGKGTAAVLLGNTDPLLNGNWRGVYGGEGYLLAAATPMSSLPAYVSSATVSGALQVWSDPSSDSRAVQKPSPSTDRIAAAWTSSTTQNNSFTIDLNCTGTSSHQVAVYCVDWAGSGTTLQRMELFESTDTGYTNPLDTRSLQLPQNGVYEVWNLSGHKVIRVTKPDGSASNKAMVSAVLFGGQ